MMEVYKTFNADTIIEFIIKPKLSSRILRMVENKDAYTHPVRTIK